MTVYSLAHWQRWWVAQGLGRQDDDQFGLSRAFWWNLTVKFALGDWAAPEFGANDATMASLPMKATPGQAALHDFGHPTIKCVTKYNQTKPRRVLINAPTWTTLVPGVSRRQVQMKKGYVFSWSDYGRLTLHWALTWRAHASWSQVWALELQDRVIGAGVWITMVQLASRATSQTAQAKSLRSVSIGSVALYFWQLMILQQCKLMLNQLVIV